MHYRTCFDSPYIGSWDLPRDRDAIVTIDRVARGELIGQKGKKDKKAIVHLIGRKKPFAANITNAKVIARLYGNDTRAWSGKSIALYIAIVEAFGEMVEAIRVRPSIPEAKAPPNGPASTTGQAPEDSDAEPEEGDADERESA